jgi:GR25 family glycosyltransferase involved in LPS biosynthesis
MERSKDRRDLLLSQFQRYSPETKLTRINAVDGKFIDGNTFINPYGQTRKFEFKDNKLNNGQIGCSLSHIYAISKAYDDGAEWVLILEDDVGIFLSELWPYSLSELTKKMPDDCGIIQLYSLNNNSYSRELYTLHNNYHCSSVGYIISRKAMKWHFDLSYAHGNIKLNTDVAIDHYMYDLGDSMKTYVINKYWLTVDNLLRDTTIGRHIGMVESYISPFKWGSRFKTMNKKLSVFVYNVDIRGNTDPLTKYIIEKAVDMPVVYNCESIPYNLVQADVLRKCKYDSRVSHITWSGESNRCHNKDSVANIITSNPTDPQDIYIPYMIRVAEDKHIDIIKGKRFKKMIDRPYTLGYINSNCTKLRDELYTKIKDLSDGEIHSMGKCKRNREKLSGTWHNNFLKLQDYRFIIAIENKDRPGYITEKMLNAYASGAITIYNSRVDTAEKYFTKGSYIDVNDFSSLDECAKYIVELDKDIDRLQGIQDMDVIINPEVFDKSYYDDIARSLGDKLLPKK